MKKRIFTFLFHVLGITLLAFFLSQFILYDIMTLSIFSPMEKAYDFEMSDLYNSVLNRRQKKIHSDVVVVGIDGLTRSDLGELVECLSYDDVSVIGMDVVFPVPYPDDSVFFSHVLSCKCPIVFASSVKYSCSDNSYIHSQCSYFENIVVTPNIYFGAANVAASTARDVVRTYKMLFDSVPSMTAVMASMILGNEMVLDTMSYIINYPSIDIKVLDGLEVLKGGYKDDLKNSVVLLGDTANINDLYLSPLDGEMSGVMVHAYTLNTILTNSSVSKTRHWLDVLIAIFICLLFASCNVLANWYMSNVGNVFLRIVQMATVMIMFYVGLIWFNYFNQYIDFSTAIVMTVMGMFASDLWFGGYAGYKIIIETISKLYKK